MSGLFAGTPLERPVTCEVCEQPRDNCTCPRDAAGRVLLPKDQQAIIRLEKRRKGKIVTVIAGLDAKAAALPDLLKQMKTSCGTGGTINDEQAIELQGDHRDAAITFLRTRGFRVKPA